MLRGWLITCAGKLTDDTLCARLREVSVSLQSRLNQLGLSGSYCPRTERLAVSGGSV
jgi:hypothetical protein